jgi:hypothetical protein
LRLITSILSARLLRSSDPPITVPQASRSFLGEGGEGLPEVRPIHMLFDLIYVLAITQLTRLVGDLTLSGASETLLRLLAVSEARDYTSWVTNYFDPQHAARAADAGRGDARESDHVTADAPPAWSSWPQVRGS